MFYLYIAANNSGSFNVDTKEDWGTDQVLSNADFTTNHFWGANDCQDWYSKKNYKD